MYYRNMGKVKTGGVRLQRMMHKINRPYLFIDTYNQRVIDNISGTILVGIDFRNMTYVSVPSKHEKEI